MLHLFKTCAFILHLYQQFCYNLYNVNLFQSAFFNVIFNKRSIFISNFTNVLSSNINHPNSKSLSFSYLYTKIKLPTPYSDDYFPLFLNVYHFLLFIYIFVSALTNGIHKLPLHEKYSS